MGCPQWDLPTLLRHIKDFGYQAVDFRSLLGDLKLWLRPEFTTQLADSQARIRDSGLAVSCISTGVRLTDRDPAAIAVCDQELLRCAELAAALDCRQLRIFGGGLQSFDQEADESRRPEVIAWVVERLGSLIDRVRRTAAVDLLIETHDAWTASAHIVAILEQVGRPEVACCWDIKHTWWMAQETARTTWERLRPWVRNTHWKDACRTAPSALMAEAKIAEKVRGAGMLVPVGEGVAPLADACELLLRDGYDGWWTLEWEKQWHPHIAGPEVAFPGFIRQIRAWQQRFRQEGGT